MKSAQLLFTYGKQILRKIQAASTEPKNPDVPAGARRDALLEAFGENLLKAAGCQDMNLRVCWNPRLRTTAGLARWQQREISLNPRLLEVSAEEVQRTLKHELAHFLAQYRAGRKRIQAHGSEWRQACTDLGIPDEPRCHNLPFKRTRIQRRHFYICRGCGQELARVRPLKRRVACLKCCRKHNAGNYHERFRFVPAPESAKVSS